MLEDFPRITAFISISWQLTMTSICYSFCHFFFDSGYEGRDYYRFMFHLLSIWVLLFFVFDMGKPVHVLALPSAFLKYFILVLIGILIMLLDCHRFSAPRLSYRFVFYHGIIAYACLVAYKTFITVFHLIKNTYREWKAIEKTEKAKIKEYKVNGFQSPYHIGVLAYFD